MALVTLHSPFCKTEVPREREGGSEKRKRNKKRESEIVCGECVSARALVCSIRDKTNDVQLISPGSLSRVVEAAAAAARHFAK